MKTKKEITEKEITDWLLENCVDKNGNLQLNNIDLKEAGFKGKVYMFGWNVDNDVLKTHWDVNGDFYQGSHRVNGSMYQDFHKVADNIQQGNHRVSGNLEQQYNYVGKKIFGEVQYYLNGRFRKKKVEKLWK